MFSYKTPKFNIKLNTKRLSIVFIAAYVLSLIPMLILGFYDFPSADDFSMALEPHQYYIQTGDFWGTIWAAVVKTIEIYNSWVGYYFSSFLTCISPSIFGEKWYFLVPFIIIIMVTYGVWYFFRALFVTAWRLDKHLSDIICMLSLLIMINSLEKGIARAEAFYWYSGAINYSFMFGLSALWIGMLIRSVFDDKKQSRFKKLILASVLGFLIGGANYMTSLGTAICSVIALFLVIMVRIGKFRLETENEDKKASFNLVWIPTCFNLFGLLVSAVAPGNSIRVTQSGGFGAVKSVLISIYNVFDICISDMTRWEVIVAFAIIAVISWKLADTMSQKLEHPILFVLFSFLFVASAMTPPLYAVGNIEAGRIHSLVWMEYVLMFSLCTFYITVWIKQNTIRKEDDVCDESFQVLNTVFVILMGALVLGSILCVKADPYYYTTTSALFDVANGNADKYYDECLERLSLLTNDNIKSVELKEFSVHPELLFYMDVTTNSEEWVNQITAIYYNKGEVYQIQNDR